jgi:hypothetical protein
MPTLWVLGRGPGADAGLAGSHDEIHACVEVERGGVDHQVIQAGILAIDPVGVADVSDPGPVGDLQEALGGLAVNTGE